MKQQGTQETRPAKSTLVEHIVRVFKFGLVGTSGLVVNTAVLFVATGLFGAHYILGATIATQASTTWNYVFSDQWVFSDKDASKTGWQRFGIFWAMNNLALVARWPMLYVLVSVLGINYLISNLVTLVVLMLVRYVVSFVVIWRTTDVPAKAPA